MDDARLTAETRPLVGLFWASEGLSQQDMLIPRARARGRMTAGERTAFAEAYGTQKVVYERWIAPYLPARDRTAYERIVTSDAWKKPSAALRDRRKPLRRQPPTHHRRNPRRHGPQSVRPRPPAGRPRQRGLPQRPGHPRRTPPRPTTKLRSRGVRGPTRPRPSGPSGWMCARSRTPWSPSGASGLWTGHGGPWGPLPRCTGGAVRVLAQ